MGTHPSKSTRQKRTQVNTTQRKTKANNQQNQVKTLCKDDLRLLNDNQLSMCGRDEETLPSAVAPWKIILVYAHCKAINTCW